MTLAQTTPTKRTPAKSALTEISLAEISLPETVPAQTNGSAFEISHVPEMEWNDIARSIDRFYRANIGKMTGGFSPVALANALVDWTAHLALSPGKAVQLSAKAMRKQMRLAGYAAESVVADKPIPPCIEPLPQDHRFTDPAWQQWPYNFFSQSFLLGQQWLHNCATDVDGPTSQHENIIDFTLRQMLDLWSPTNFPATNPVLQRRLIDSGGTCLFGGAINATEDMLAFSDHKSDGETKDYEVGKMLAATPGKIVYRNRLIELIQYSPTTEQVRPEPILIVPAWIMKYYILDLKPENSLVRYLVGQGYTVFMISWLNPTAKDRDLGMDDYRQLGVMAALDAIDQICPGQQVHASGYCIGGTLLSIAAATMARDGADRLRSMTLFAAQTDFSEAGELLLFINPSQIRFLTDMMWQQGYLDSRQMGGAFQILHSSDLIWSRLVQEYLLGERSRPSELTAWNADGTRMPYRMHAEYLHELFLNNALSRGHYLVDNRPIALTDLRLPTFVVGTESDHIAPWRSVHKYHLYSSAPVTFVLTNGGHNAGIVSEPGHKNRHYRIMTRQPEQPYLDPEDWLEKAKLAEGSWWPAWVDWLDQRSGEPATLPAMGDPNAGLVPLGDAPGTYILGS